ncbi:serpin family protein [Cumulibacter soli]|uniref:serpin family protein n=1 Tax=Cumulibacter soli TaxID=2546344 RepID=UPI0010689634|nr:serpin family protein [Cumulibacter soli]
MNLGQRAVTRRAALGLAGGLALIVAAAACSAEPDKPEPSPEGFDDPDAASMQTAADDPAAAAYQAGTTGFALAMLAEAVAAEPAANAVISPLSISQCMALIAQGADGDTLTQIAEAFGCADATELRTGANAEITAIAALQQAQFDMANTSFVSDSFAVKDDYASIVAQWFGVAPHSVDFSDPSGATATINDWVAQRTNDKIPDLLESGQVTPDTRTVLVNALYLNALWAQDFNPDKTSADAFTLGDGSTSEADYMQDHRHVPYVEQDGAIAFELPYKDDGLVALFYLPAEDTDLAEAIGSLTPESVSDVVEQLAETEAQLYIPVFEAKQRIELSSALEKLGIVDAFDADVADFSALADEPTQLSFVQHEAWLKVAEKGTEGAAATAGGMEASSANPDDSVEIRLDRPFLFAVRVIATGSIAFVAAIQNPSDN